MQGVNENMMDKVEEAFSILDTYLEGHDWVAGNQLTIADYSIVSTVSTVEVTDIIIAQFITECGLAIFNACC